LQFAADISTGIAFSESVQAIAAPPVSMVSKPGEASHAEAENVRGWIGRALMSGNLALEKASGISVGFLSLLWIAIVGLSDYWSGYEKSMLIFYLIPVTLGTWFIGRNYGLFLSVLSIVTSSVTDIASGLPEVRYWNGAVGLGSYAIFVWLLSGWRNLLLQLDDRVQIRTAALQEEIMERSRLENEITDLTERERRRLGHHLHDGLCQHLIGTALAAQILRERLAATSSSDASEADKVVELIEKGIDLTRNLAGGLFSPDLEGEELAAALQGLAHSATERFGVECEFHYDRQLATRCDSVVATQLYRIAQEAVVNAGKHANASRIVIELDRDEGELRLNIFDNGAGFVQEQIGGGLGVRMMRHGAGLIGATFALGRNGAAGTVVSCSLGLPNGASEPGQKNEA
jgi:signal transduction histidine kinase